ncbi:hypothetical protein ACIPY0_12325 [Paenarthrobacter nicotinovorans]|uniref:hypothetical protein n=1 Tax=Paenarthrobacter nicotinovorans TaxID=29320 RepID=UPI003804F4BC
MTRVEAAAKAYFEVAYVEWDHADESIKADVRADTERALHAADAHDAANGVHRVSMDEATVERVARALFPSYWEREFYHEHSLATGQAMEESQRECIDHIRAVLAAAVKEGQ